jgi:hypothetical protein
MQIKIIWLFSIVFLWNHFSINAQSGFVTITNGTQPLAFATVINMQTGKGVFATENGQVRMGSPFFSSGDTVKISYTGYRDTIFQLPILQDKIALQFQPISLENVAVYPCLNPAPIVLKNYIKHASSHSLGMGGGGSGSWAAYVPNGGSVKGFIETITIEQSFFTVPSNARKAPFKIRLLHYDTLTGQPGMPIIAKEWIIYPTSNKSVLKIAEENLKLPIHGLVVCIDYFFAGEQYTYKRKTSFTNSNGKTQNEIMIYYGASFRAVEGDNLAGVGYHNGNKLKGWNKSYRIKQSALMVSMGIKACN